MKKNFSKALEFLYELEDYIASKPCKPGDDWDKGYNAACLNIGEDIRACIENIQELFGVVEQ
jgi:hypothetical protein